MRTFGPGLGGIGEKDFSDIIAGGVTGGKGNADGDTDPIVDLRNASGEPHEKSDDDDERRLRYRL